MPFSPVSSRAQYAVLTKELNVKKVHCVIGFSMGGQQVCAACGRIRIEKAHKDTTGVLLACNVPGLRGEVCIRAPWIRTKDGKLT